MRKNSNARFYGPPYHGSVLAQLRASALPEHAGRSILITQILKIIQPVTYAVPWYDGYMPPPEEGSLFFRRSVPGPGVRSKL
ncbi:hypothetical protein BD779DRAFT_1680050 [Infundibulicybe gibba]|nr:hypothetical protein BD779DRAFT_1680050 [Infundibulicybe gibba]